MPNIDSFEYQMGELFRLKNRDVLNLTVYIQGGGAKGGWQASFLNELENNPKFNVQCCIGSSAGAINAVLLNQKKHNTNYDPSDFWTKISKSSKIKMAWDLSVFKIFLRFLKGIFFFSNYPKRKPYLISKKDIIKI